MRKSTRSGILALFSVVCVFFGVISCSNVGAVASKETIMEKWMLSLYRYCVNNLDDFNAEVPRRYTGLVVDSISKGSVSDKLMLPSFNYGNTVKPVKDSTYGTINCKDVLRGTNGLDYGVLAYGGFSDVSWSEFDTSLALLKYLGYGSKSGNPSFSIKGTVNADGISVILDSWTIHSNAIQGIKNEDGSISYKSIEGTNENANIIISINNDNDNETMSAEIKTSCNDSRRISLFEEIDLSSYNSIDSLATEIRSQIVNKTNFTVTCDPGTNFFTTYSYSFKDNDIVVSSNDEYDFNKMTKLTSIEKTIYRAMTGEEPDSSVGSDTLRMIDLTPSELYILYMHYLDNAISKNTVNRMTCDQTIGHTNLTPVLMKDSDGTIKQCYVNLNGTDINKEVTTQIDGLIGVTTIEEIVAWLQNENNVNDENLKDVANTREESGGSPLDLSETCGTGGAAGSLGWILCPVLFLTQGATEGLYEMFVEPALTVSPRLFSIESSSDDSNNGVVYSAWSIFQQISNVLFIILLLFVIFSQLTGVGIDNYGIKKILPKMIVGVILINVSYYLCVFAIDFSNIVGVGIRNILEGLGSGISVGNIEGQGLQLGAMTGVGIMAGAVAVKTIWNNPAILLSLLVSGLGLLISIFFVFFIISARQAILIMLTVVAPIAFACYMLPNTKSIFDKWLKTGWTLLLVFPICGLMIGGGNFASRLLLGVSNGNIISALIAMAASVVPIFFIPSVLKSSLTAVGKLGGTIAGLGTTVRGGVTGSIRNSDAYKDLQRMGQERRILKKSGYSEKKGGLTVLGGVKSSIARSRFGRTFGMNKRQAALLSQAKKNSAISQDATATLMAEMSERGFQKYKNNHPNDNREDYYRSMFDDAAVDGDVMKMNSVIDAAKRRGTKPKDIAKWIRKAAVEKKFKFKDVQSRSNWMNELVSKYDDVLSTDFELKTWAMRGGNEDEELRNYGDYAASVDPANGRQYIEIGDIKPEDMLKLSGDSLAGMIASGKLSSGMARTILSLNPNISEDKKIMLGALANNKTNSARIMSNGGAVAFKRDVDTLSMDHRTTASLETFVDMPNILNDRMALVDFWVSNPSQDVIVRNIDIRNSEGQKNQTDNLMVDLGGAGSSTLQNIASTTNTTSNSINMIAGNTGTIAGNTDTIAGNTGTIAGNTRMIANSNTTIASNTGHIATNSDSIASNVNSIEANNERIAGNTGRTADNTDNIAEDSKQINNKLDEK